jgi:hypothetical protein
MQSAPAAGTSANRHGGLVAQLGVVWWALAMLGCLALAMSPWFPWVSILEGTTTINVNGFNTVTLDSALPNLLSGAADAGQTNDGTGTDTTLPSLSSIPAYSGGTDASARGGIFVLVLGATALFIAPWTLAGEIDRRRSMARIVFVLGGMSLVPLLRDLLTTLRATNALGPSTVGAGMIAGLAGSVVTMIGAGLSYWALGRKARP